MIQAETIEEMEDMIKSEPRAQDKCADTSVRMPVGKPVVDNSTRYGHPADLCWWMFPRILQQLEAVMDKLSKQEAELESIRSTLKDIKQRI